MPPVLRIAAWQAEMGGVPAPAGFWSPTPVAAGRSKSGESFRRQSTGQEDVFDGGANEGNHCGTHQGGQHDQHDLAQIVEPFSRLETQIDASHLSSLRFVSSNAHASIHVVEALIHGLETRRCFDSCRRNVDPRPRKTLIVGPRPQNAAFDLSEVLFTRLFGVGKPLFHPLFERKELPVHSETEFLEVFLPDEFIRHVPGSFSQAIRLAPRIPGCRLPHAGGVATILSFACRQAHHRASATAFCLRATRSPGPAALPAAPPPPGQG